ncbi:hypothetical protein FA95DRAFT_1490180 [Auriscalpium vulgare]|uniref:Uncharacterized protein n=1 Tax=Auriscalpium vulgare TaxID=40419 RepID=A0ACB8RXM4_9AGAM|nr:hypothetical protein FA95DRAFT_1490180 [Auriscalpium vulgare]
MLDDLVQQALAKLAQPVDRSLPLHRRTWCAPAFGAFVVFTLDPVATMEVLDDPIAVEAARAIPRRTYVGYVTQVLDLPSTSRRYHRCCCYILSRGLPQSSPDNFIDDQMCVAVAPSKHPGGRPAIEPSPPLPWENLYLHSASIFTLRLKTATEAVDHAHSPMISLAQYVDVMHYTSMDTTRRHYERHASAPSEDLASQTSRASSPVSSAQGSRVSSAKAEGFDEPDSSDEDDLSSEDDSAGSDGDSSHGSVTGSLPLDDLPEGLAAALMSSELPPNQLITVASFDLNLSTANEFSDACYMREDLRTIKRCAPSVSLQQEI